MFRPLCNLSVWHRCHTWDSHDLAWRVERTQADEPRSARGCPRMLYAARSAPGPHPRGPAHLSGWNLNLQRDVAGRVKPWVKHGESRFHRVLPGATATCSLGTETCLHRSGAAGDRAALPGTIGAGGHGGARWGSGWVKDLASLRSGVQTDFYSFGLHLTLASSCYRLRKLYFFLPKKIQYFLRILKAKGTLRPPELQTLFGTWELIYAASL